MATFLASCAALLGGCDNRRELLQEPAGIRTAGPAGETLEITEGRLAGVKIEVPAGAISGPIELSVAPTVATAQPGFDVVGPAILATPADVTFDQAVRVSLPYTAGRPVVLSRDRDGRVVELGPVALDFANQLVTVEVLSLRTFWPAARFFNGLRTFGYMPLTDADTWTFDDGTVLSTTRTTTEPGFAGETIFRLEFESGTETFGFYLQGSSFTAIELIGEYTRLGASTFQQLHGPGVFLPTEVTLGQAVESEFTYLRHVPYGTEQPSATGLGSTQVRVSFVGELEVPADSFEDALRVEFSVAGRDASGNGTIQAMTLYLVRQVGPVAIETAAGRAELVFAEVSGQTIGTPEAGK